MQTTTYMHKPSNLHSWGDGRSSSLQSTFHNINVLRIDGVVWVCCQLLRLLLPTSHCQINGAAPFWHGGVECGGGKLYSWFIVNQIPFTLTLFDISTFKLKWSLYTYTYTFIKSTFPLGSQFSVWNHILLKTLI